VLNFIASAVPVMNLVKKNLCPAPVVSGTMFVCLNGDHPKAFAAGVLQEMCRVSLQGVKKFSRIFKQSMKFLVYLN